MAQPSRIKRTALVALIPLIFAGSVLVNSSPASAASTNYPYASASYCGTMSGPAFANQLMMYQFWYRTNGGRWVTSKWMASAHIYNWVYSGGAWQGRQTNTFHGIPRPGDTVEQWAYVYTASGGAWRNLGSCTQGGIVMR